MNYKSISLIGGTLLLSTLTANGQKKNTQPNILFILCDDMGRYAFYTGIRRQSRQRAFQSFIHDRATFRPL